MVRLTGEPRSPPSQGNTGEAGGAPGTLRPRASLASLSLATQPDRALRVPPMSVQPRHQPLADSFVDHLLKGERLDAHLLRVRHPNESGGQDRYYILGDVIHAGQGGEIRGLRALDRDISQQYIVKIIPMEAGLQAPERSASHANALRETHIPALVNHPLAPHFVIDAKDEILAVMPMMGANVDDVLSKLRTEQSPDGSPRAMNMAARRALTWRIIDGVSGQLTRLHARGLTHGDIKPGNLLLRRDGEIQLADFGSGRTQATITPNAKESLVGTLGFLPPEAYGQTPYDGRKADVWALGISSVLTLTGGFPFRELVSEGRMGPALLDAWTQSLRTVAERGAGNDPVAHPISEHPEVQALHAHLFTWAPSHYALVLKMLEPQPATRIGAEALLALMGTLPQAAGQEMRALSHELTALARSGAFAMEEAIGHDPWLNMRHYGEATLARPALRRHHSEANPSRPFVRPFADHPTRPPPPVGALAAWGLAQAAWKSSPEFFAVSDFLFDQYIKLEDAVAGKL